MNTQRTTNYEQLPTVETAGQEHDYYNISTGSNINTNSPYEQLNIDTRSPHVYQQQNNYRTMTNIFHMFVIS